MLAAVAVLPSAAAAATAEAAEIDAKRSGGDQLSSGLKLENEQLHDCREEPPLLLWLLKYLDASRHAWNPLRYPGAPSLSSVLDVQWIEEFEGIKEQHRQQQHREDQQAQQAAAATTSSVVTEFPQARIIKIAKLSPSVKKLSAEGARYLNLATAAALRQFTLRSLSGRENDKTLMVDDILAMINRGGLPLKFLQECKYVITEEEEVEESEKNADCCPSMEIDEIDVEAQEPSTSSFPRPLPLAGNSSVSNHRRLGAKASKGAPMRTADIASFFKRA
ncbi:hypothetical protein Emed_002734 [Eimeria media]